MVTRFPELEERAEHADRVIYSPASWGTRKPKRKAEIFDGPLEYIIVHHSAGPAPSVDKEHATIQSIQSWHMGHNEWADIGYNFIVCPSGHIYQGRQGPMFRLVVGAHCYGHNEGSVGICCLGDYGKAAPPEAMLDSLVWLLDKLHFMYCVDNLPPAKWFSRVVKGHRDLGTTECPGDKLYALLPSVVQGNGE